MRKKILAALLVTLACGMITGCGDSSSSTPATADKTTAVTVVAEGTSGAVKTTAPVNNVLGVTASGATFTAVPLIIAGTVITPELGSTSIPAGEIKLLIQTPTNGTTSGMKVPSGKVLAAAAGAVDISIPGVNGFSVPAPGLTVNIPVTACPSATNVPITVVRFDKSSYTATGTCTNNLTTVTGLTKFSSVLVNPTFATGS